MTSTPSKGPEYDPTFGKQDDANDGNAITAFWIAGIRAQEYQKGEKAIVKDPYAQLLMKDDGWKNFQEIFRLRAAVLNRTVFHDRNIIMAAKELGVRQTIIIGAGLDTRAFRLFQDYPDMHVIEVDHPNLFAYKEPRLKDVKPSCKRSIVALDYDEVTEWDIRAREKFGFDPSKPSIFVLEGVTMYIPLEDEMALYKKVDANAAVNSLITGCSQRVLGGPRDLGNGIVWHDTDRKAQMKIMEKWGLSFKPYHTFGHFGVCMMYKGIKRHEPYSTQGNLTLEIILSQIFSPQGITMAAVFGAVSTVLFTQLRKP